MVGFTKCSNHLQQILDQSTQMKFITNFMTASINRCMDFGKANHGMKLIPNNETFLLSETILLPIRVMQTTQEKVKISLRPVSDTICNCIISDKQWLQENILCLLSNAVKYSHRGEVSMSVYLHPLNQADIMTATNEGSDVLLFPTAKQLAIMNDQSSYSSATNLKKVERCLTTKSSLDNLNTEMYGASVINTFPTQASPTAITSMSCPISPADGLTRSQQHTLQNNQLISLSEATTPVLSMRRTSNFTHSKILQSKRTLQNFDKSDCSKWLKECDNDNVDDETMQKYLIVEVEDTGIGLSETAMNHLFSPFHQAQRLAGGTGLGLYSLSQRMEALNGFYGVENRRDGRQGSMFWFAFPYRPDETMVENRSLIMTKLSSINLVSTQHLRTSSSIKSMKFDSKMKSTGFASSPRVRPLVPSSKLSTTVAAVPTSDPLVNSKASSVAPMSNSLQSSNAFHILLVDDSIPIQKMVSSLLRRNSYIVDTAENGVVCLEKVQQKLQSGKSYDLILMDLQMPVMDGLEAMRRLRQMEKEQNQIIQQQQPPQEELSTSIEAIFQSLSSDDHNSIVVPTILHHLIICISANADQENAQESLEAGADAIMPKPFTMDALRKLLAKLDV
jgi:CheY-like chemotaxis protein